MDKINVVIASTAKADNGKLQFTTTGGMIWKQTDGDPARRPKPGAAVEISKSAFGGYWCQLDRWTAVRCARIDQPTRAASEPAPSIARAEPAPAAAPVPTGTVSSSSSPPAPISNAPSSLAATNTQSAPPAPAPGAAAPAPAASLSPAAPSAAQTKSAPPLLTSSASSPPPPEPAAAPANSMAATASPAPKVAAPSAAAPATATPVASMTSVASSTVATAPNEAPAQVPQDFGLQARKQAPPKHLPNPDAKSDSFGLPQNDEPESLEVTIASTGKAANGKLLITTAENGVWFQTDGNPARAPRVGMKVMISKSSFGGHWCELDRWTTVRCTKLK